MFAVIPIKYIGMKESNMDGDGEIGTRAEDVPRKIISQR